jgi:hypothetical protein
VYKNLEHTRVFTPRKTIHFKDQADFENWLAEEIQ